MSANLGTARGQILMETGSAVQAVRSLKSTLTDLGNTRIGAPNTSGVTGAFDSVRQSASGLRDNIRDAVSGMGAEFQQLSGWIDRNEQTIRAAGQGLTAYGVAATGAFGGALYMAANFEQQMSLLKVATDATGDELEGLRQLALQLGKDTSFSATEAAAAITEMGKAGLTTEQIMSGAAEAIVALAEAGEIGLVDATNAVTAAMSQFGLAATDATMIVDTLARGAAISTADLGDLSSALSYVGGTANALGLSLPETTAALAALNDQGIRGTKAGTTLNQMLTSLLNPSAKAATAMDELGLSAGGTFSIIDESSGTMKDMGTIIENVYEATKDLTEVERARYLNQIFGEQGGRAINALLQTQTEEARAAGKSWEDYASGVNEGTTAAEMAAGRMDNLKGDIEQLMGGLETLAISATSAFLPVARFFVQMADAIIGALTSLPTPIQAAVMGLVGLSGALSLGAGGFLLLLPKINETAKAFGVFKAAIQSGKLLQLPGILGRASTAMANFTASAKAGDFSIRNLGKSVLGLARAHPVLAGVGLAAAAIGVAYKTNFLGMKDAVDGVVGSAKRLGADMMAAFKGAGESAAIAEDQVAGFAEATHVVDGVTVYTAFRTNAEGEKEKVGEIVESIANADGKTAQVKIKAEDGEYWATIDLATGEISDAQIPVKADTAPFYERINAALDVVKGRFDAAGLEWGVSLVSGIQSAVTVIGQFASKVMSHFRVLNQIMNPVSAVLVSIARAMQTIDFGPLQSVADGAIAAFEGVGYAIQRFGEGARSIISAISAAWQGDFSGALAHARAALDSFRSGMDYLVQAAHGIGAAVGGAFNLIGVQLINLAGRFPVLGDSLRAVGTLFRQIGEVAREAWGVIADVLAGDVSGALDGLGDLAEDVGKMIVDAFVAVGEIIGDVGDILQDGLGWAFDKLRSKFSSFTNTFNRLQGILTSAIGVVKNLGEAFASLLRGDFSGFFSNIGEALGDLVKGVANAAVLIPTLLWDAFRAIDWGGIAGSLADGARSALQGLADLSGELLSWLQRSAEAIDFGAIGSAILDGIQSAISGVSAALDWVLNVGVPALTGWVVDVAGDVWGAIKGLAGWVGDVVSGSIEFLLNIAGSVASALGDVWSSIKSLIGTVGSWLADFFGIGDDGSVSGSETKSASGGFDFSFSLAGAIANGLGEAWSSLKSLISSVAGWLVDFFGISESGTVAGLVAKQASAAFNFAMQFLGTVANGLGAAWSSITGLIGDAASWLVDFFGIDELGNVAGLVSKTASAAFNFAVQFLGAIANGLGEVWSSFTGLVGSVGSWLVDFFGIGNDGSMSSLVSKTATAALDFVADFGSDVKDNMGSAWDSVKSLVGSVSSVAKDLVSDAWGGVTKTVTSAIDFVVEISGTVSGAIGDAWDFIFGGGGDGGDGGAQTIEQALEQVRAAIETGLTNIANEFINFDASGVMTAFNDRLVSAAGAMSGESVANAIKSWIDRAISQVPALLTGEGLMTIPRGMDTQLATAFGSMSGASLSTSIAGWFTRAMPQVITTIQPQGLTLARGLDTAMQTGLGQMSGASLSSGIAAWFTRAVPQAITSIQSLGLTVARGLDTALQTGLGGLSGANLATNIVSWINRAQTTASSTVNMTTLATGIATKLQTAIEPKLQQIVTAFRTFANTIRTVTQQMGNDVRSQMQRMAQEMDSQAKQAQRNVDSAFKTMSSNVRSSLTSTVSAARSAASDLRSAISNGAREASSALRGEASSWAGIVSGNAGAMRAAGYSVGVAASSGVASGLRAALGDVRAAAAEIIAEVDRAMRKAGEIRSPSRLTRRTSGELGAGVVLGLRDWMRDISRAARSVANAAIPQFDPLAFERPALARAATRWGGALDRGGVVINNTWHITQQPGESGEAFADRALKLMLNGYMDGGTL